ncbi:MAG: DUF1501 domain-containing protein, partial [Pseudomonadota bacterium]
AALKGLAALSGYASTGISSATADGPKKPHYRALVCIALDGGNDHANTLVPYDRGQYQEYANNRDGIALEWGALNALSLKGDKSRSAPQALHPSLVGIKRLLEDGDGAIVANVGPLEEPTTLADFQAGRVRLPTQLFSHSDQKRSWYTAIPTRWENTGWLGRLGDAISEEFYPNTSMPFLYTTENTQIILQGQRARAMSIIARGRTAVRWQSRVFGNRQNADDLKKLVTLSGANILEQQLALDNSEFLRNAAQYSSEVGAIEIDRSEFPKGKLGSQLATAFEAIKAANGLSQPRQILFANHSGFDVHASLTDRHSVLLKEFDEAVSAFVRALKREGYWDSVLIFTISDFGRALLSNGRGSDHGWGGHQFVFGGGVNGANIYGRVPELTLNTAEDVGQGRLLPTTSMAEYYATIAKWFGVDPDAVSYVIPNASKFDHKTLDGLLS